MSFVNVRSVSDDENLKISFTYDGKKFEFNRKKTDPMYSTLNRIALKLKPKKKSVQKHNNTPSKAEAQIEILLISNDGKIYKMGDTNEQCFVDGAFLKINSTTYSVVINAPNILHLKLADNVMESFPVVPDVKFEFSCLSKSKFQWYRGVDTFCESWEMVSEEFIYTPKTSDISYFLKCVVNPVSNDISGHSTIEAISPEPVSAGPGVCLFDERHLYTEDFLFGIREFRMISYNILADIFADTDYAKQILYPYVPEYAIKADYRGQLIMKELLGYNADLICLQECQLSMYDCLLKPALEMNGYFSSLMMKIGEMPEGSGLFYRREKFNHISDLSISVRDAMNLKCNENIINLVPSELLENVRKKKAIGQIHLLQERNTQKLLCVLNTHLYFERFAVRIRLLQMVFLMNYISDALNIHAESLNVNVEDITVIVCGDLNCDAKKSIAVLSYLAGSEIHRSDEVWKQKEDGSLEENVDIRYDLQCPLLLSQLSGYPDFTVYVPHCKTTLDYIFGSKHLKVNNFIPLPGEEEIQPYVGLPSIVYPSDHLALVIDVEWKL